MHGNGLVAALGWAGAVAVSAGAAEPLRVGETLSGSILGDEVDVFTMDLEAGTFVYGAVDQLTVDVVVTVKNPEGEVGGTYDGPARGLETFTFETASSGVYTIEVAGFEGAEGDYSVRLRRAEPAATTPEGRVEQLMVAYDDPGTPGGVVAVVRGGEVVFSLACGAADLEHGVMWTDETVTNIGSTSKQFVAYAIMMLVERGLVDLDEDVRTYMPELPAFDQVVTVRHLLTHTSGYREFLNTLALAGRRLDLGDGIERHELIELVQRQPELQNWPGAEFNYNNTGYGFLANIVERVSGETFPDWMDANVFTPLGMDDTAVKGDIGQVIPNRAEGYVNGEDGFRQAADLGASMGAGGIYTTIGDLAKWVKNYREGTLDLDDNEIDIFEVMTTPYELNNGEETGYGFGLFVAEFNGLAWIHHGGADVAHRSNLMYFPEIDAAVITQSNNADFDGSIAGRTAQLFFEESMESDDEGAEDEGDSLAEASESEDFDPGAFEPESFDRFVGRYEFDAVPGFILTFTRDGETLYAQATGQPKLEIVPDGPNRFRLLVVDAAVTFNVAEDGSVPTLTLHQNGDQPATRLEEELWSPTAAELEAYTGRFFSEELETFYEIVVEGEGDEAGLVIKHRRFDDVSLEPETKTKFNGGFPVAQVEFVMDSDAVTGLRVGNGRTRDVAFERVE